MVAFGAFCFFKEESCLVFFGKLEDLLRIGDDGTLVRRTSLVTRRYGRAALKNFDRLLDWTTLRTRSLSREAVRILQDLTRLDSGWGILNRGRGLLRRSRSLRASLLLLYRALTLEDLRMLHGLSRKFGLV